VENLIMMVDNAGDVFKLCTSIKRKHKLYSKYSRYISYWCYFKQFIGKFIKNLTTRVPNNTQIYFPYGTVTSACQGSGLACTRTVSIFRRLTYMQMRYRNEIDTVNQLQLN